MSKEYKVLSINGFESAEDLTEFINEFAKYGWMPLFYCKFGIVFMRELE